MTEDTLSIQLEVLHCIYTNAPGVSSDSGYRFVTLPKNYNAQEIKILKEWVKSLGSSDLKTGVAAVGSKCFRIQNTPYVCFALVHKDVFYDNYGREGGSISHVFCCPVLEGKYGWSNGPYNLLVKLIGFELPEKICASWLSMYMNRYVELEPIARELVDKSQLITLLKNHTDFTKKILSAYYLSHKTPSVIDVPQSDPLDFAKKIFLIGTLLPPRLRLGIAWSLGLGGSHAIEFRMSGGESKSTADIDIIDRLLAWLTRYALKNELEEITNITCNWKIDSWDYLYKII